MYKDHLQRSHAIADLNIYLFCVDPFTLGERQSENDFERFIHEKDSELDQLKSRTHIQQSK